MRIGQFHPPRVGEAGGGLERSQGTRTRVLMILAKAIATVRTTLVSLLVIRETTRNLFARVRLMSLVKGIRSQPSQLEANMPQEGRVHQVAFPQSLGVLSETLKPV